MFKPVKNGVAALSLGIAAIVGVTAPAQAATVYESVTHTNQDTGDYSIYDQRYFGAGFTLNQATTITAIGGEFDNIAGNIFGAIVALPSAGGLPSFSPTQLAANALAHVVFTGSGSATDQSAPLSLTLAAGNYAVIFGGDSQFAGADGTAGMTVDNDLIGSPNIFQYFGLVYGDKWTHDSVYDGLRFFVEGTPAGSVPEPATWAMMILGIGMVGGALRRRTLAGALSRA
ncbi:MAG TPA: PEPxxWA-CTERM sorting domain-containing protein [Novosphingobium sp.]